MINVINKTVAEKDMFDNYSHRIQKNSLYIEGVYLEKVNQNKKKVFHKELKKSMFYTSEVFFPTVPIHAGQISAEEYQ